MVDDGQTALDLMTQVRNLKTCGFHCTTSSHFQEAVVTCQDRLRTKMRRIEMKGGLAEFFKKGQAVMIDKPRFKGMIGEIEKVNSKKCKVWIDDSTWNVPHSMLIHA